MLIKDLVGIKPSTLTITPTHKCTASCHECCFGCNPKITHILETEKIIQYIDRAISEFPSIQVVVITGGECFLLGDDLDKIIKHAASYKVITRVVTNAYWAHTYEIAVNRLTKLVDSGLIEINFSTGDNHQNFVSFENIINAARASYDLGVRTICIAVESPPDANFKSTDILCNTLLEPMIKEGVLKYIDASWMKFKKGDESKRSITFYENTKSCPHIFTGLVINPYSQLLACCGLTVEYNSYLKLGCLDNNSFDDLYYEQYNDLFKFWLHADGPEYIYDAVMNVRGLKKKK